MSRAVDNRRMKVMQLDAEGCEREHIAAELGVSTATVFRDLRWLKEGTNCRDLMAEHHKRANPLGQKVVEAALDAVQAAPAIRPAELLVNAEAGPKGPAERARAMEAAADMWRLHVPDALVALNAFQVDGSLLIAWLAEGRRQILAGQTEAWEAQLYLRRARAFGDSLTGGDGLPGILERLFSLLNSDDPKVVLAAAKLLHEQGGLRQYYTKQVEVRVTAEVPGEAVEGVGEEASGLAAALGMIGADA